MGRGKREAGRGRAVARAMGECGSGRVGVVRGWGRSVRGEGLAAFQILGLTILFLNIAAICFVLWLFVTILRWMGVL